MESRSVKKEKNIFSMGYDNVINKNYIVIKS